MHYNFLDLSIIKSDNNKLITNCNNYLITTNNTITIMSVDTITTRHKYILYQDFNMTMKNNEKSPIIYSNNVSAEGLQAG